MNSVANFSRQTIVEAISLMEEWEHSKIERFILKFELENKIPYKEINRPQIANMIIHHIIDSHNQTEPEESTPLFEIIAHIAGELKEPDSDIPAFMGNQLFSDPGEKFKNSLTRDGYTISGGKLKAVVPESADLPSREDELREFLDEKGMTEILKHLEQAIAAHKESDWKAVNREVKNFSKNIFRELNHNPDSLVDAFLNRIETEVEGISEQESTFRYHLAVLIANRMLKK